MMGLKKGTCGELSMSIQIFFRLPFVDTRPEAIGEPPLCSGAGWLKTTFWSAVTAGADARKLRWMDMVSIQGTDMRSANEQSNS